MDVMSGDEEVESIRELIEIAGPVGRSSSCDSWIMSISNALVERSPFGVYQSGYPLGMFGVVITSGYEFVSQFAEECFELVLVDFLPTADIARVPLGPITWTVVACRYSVSNFSSSKWDNLLLIITAVPAWALLTGWQVK
jgi:hypothetical protein